MKIGKAQKIVLVFSIFLGLLVSCTLFDGSSKNKTKRYTPEEMEALLQDSSFIQQGVASRYHSDLQGQITATGEEYDSTALTAASRVIPLGTWVKVINAKTGQHVTVLINDRGPYVKNRVIDLSHQAADSIGLSTFIGLRKVIILKDEEPKKAKRF